MSNFAAVLLFAFLFKLLNISLLTVILRRHFDSIIESILSSWLIIQTTLYSWMALVSFPHMLNQPSMWGFLIFSFIVLNCLYYFFARKSIITLSKDEVTTYFSKPAILAIILSILVFFWLFYRSLYFLDNTWDAMTYELTRIFFYAHYHTLFILQPTQAFNIFANEWNGELNSLFYLLATANSQGSAFGNVEIWLLTFVCFIYILGEFGVVDKFRVLFAWCIATAPVFIGLAMTVKGDLLAATMFLLGFTFLLKTLKTNYNPFYFISALIALGISAGAKINLVPSVGLLLIFIFIYYFKESDSSKRNKFLISLLAFILLCINNSRYIANIFAYHNPFEHIEPINYSFKNLMSNVYGLISSSYSFDFKLTLHEGVLSQGLNLVIISILLWLLFALFSFIKNRNIINNDQLLLIKKIGKSKLFILGFCLVLSFLIFSASVQWEPWSFRYFLSWIILLMFILIGLGNKYIRLSQITLFFSTFVVILISFLNIYYLSFQNYEAFPVNFQTAKNLNLIDRENPIIDNIIFNPILTAAPKILTTKQNILILNQIDSLVSFFFGINYSNTVTLVNSNESLMAQLIKHHFNFIVFSGNPLHIINETALNKRLISFNYLPILKNNLLCIYYNSNEKIQ